jgi:hypothetical protein
MPVSLKTARAAPFVRILRMVQPGPLGGLAAEGWQGSGRAAGRRGRVRDMGER